MRRYDTPRLDALLNVFSSNQTVYRTSPPLNGAIQIRNNKGCEAV